MSFKIPPQRIKSDECAVHVGREIVDGKITNQGTPYYVHKGEWVEILPIATLQETLAIMALTQGKADSLKSFTDPLSALCVELSKRVTAWNWTDMAGQPMPPPYLKPDVFRGLHTDELLWLMTAAQGESDRKNGSTPLPATSLAKKVSR